MTIIGIDPGPTTSGMAKYDTETKRVIWAKPDADNEYVLNVIRSFEYNGATSQIACESIEALYAHVGKETIRTIRFVGRIEEACFRHVLAIGFESYFLSPQEVKKRVCGTSAAKDPAVRQALIDTLGPQGTKKDPGPTYGVSKHAWRALAVAVAATITI